MLRRRSEVVSRCSKMPITFAGENTNLFDYHIPAIIKIFKILAVRQVLL